MSTTPTCPDCGAPLDPAARGLCPRCLAELAIALDAPESGANVEMPSGPAGNGDAAAQPRGQAGGELPALGGLTERPGSVIGRYKLLEEIGEGGFGVVYLAEQVEPVRRQVALKIIKPGMDTREVVARFEVERQALALMDHPNIAKVLDGGTTETGRPYFVMELVRGISITEYCDQEALSTIERLQIFMEVCHAVQHAHQKGIIHRDLKPGNILVTQSDGNPVPKIIDFGVAKALGHKLTEKTLFTVFQRIMGTPAYMSPEQAELSGLDIDTRSDIYSLGVLLYELLTGVTPFDAETLGRAALDEVRRIIRDTDPPKPSTRLQTLGGRLPEVAKRRHTEPVTLSRMVRGDLDWIVMKCLEKDRVRRYDTADGLAADLKRHLCHEPVLAVSPSSLYRAGKFIRRHRLAFAAASAVAGALVIGALVATWQAVRATRAERLATERFQESAAITKFLTGVFQSPDPARDGRTITVAEALDKAVKDLDSNLAGQPALRTELLSVLGETYYGLALYTNAISLQERVREYCLATAGPEAPDTLNAMVYLAASYEMGGRPADALGLLERVAPLLRKVRGLEHPDTLQAMGNLAAQYTRSGRWAEALPIEEQVLALRRKLLGPKNRDTLTAMGNLAGTYRMIGSLDKGLQVQAEVLSLRREVLGPKDPDTLAAMTDLAGYLDALGRVEEAIPLQERSVELKREVLPPNHRFLGIALENLASMYEQVGRATQGLKLREEQLELCRRFKSPDDPETLWAMANLASAFEAVGRPGEALMLREEWLSVWGKVRREDNPAAWNGMIGVAASYRATNRLEEAIALNRSALEGFKRTTGATNEYTLNAMTELAITLRMAGNTEAISLETDALRLKRQYLRKGHPMLLESLDNLAQCYEQCNRIPDAEPLRRELAELKANAKSKQRRAGESPTVPAVP
ncbi:MAG TPA: tetratricopeptide repeat protein [Verrucomicrobiae bacterium]